MTTRSERLRSSGRALAAILAGLALALVPARALADEPEATSPARDEQDLEAKRERFRAGSDRYRAGAFAEAIAIWEEIYAELGPERGYRLAFNIARAYEQLAATRSGSPAAIGDTTKALEHYAVYVEETTRRREAGEVLEPLIERQEQEAKARLGSIVLRGEPDVVVTIDDAPTPRHAGQTVWVVPGRHVVTFHPGTPAERTVAVTVDAGKANELSAPTPPPTATTPVSPPLFETRRERPFDRSILFVAAGVTAATLLVPVIFYSNAWSIYDEYVATSPSDEVELARLRADYDTAQTNAYASIAIPSVALATTLGLTAYWLWGAKDARVPVKASLAPRGGVIGAAASF